MVRTKGDSAGRKAVAAKAPRKQVGGSSSSAASSMRSPSSSGKSKNKYSGGNPVKWWPSPTWQKGIGTFFVSDNLDNSSSSPEEGPSSHEQPGQSCQEHGIEDIGQDRE